jgi:hypothetical protein
VGWLGITVSSDGEKIVKDLLRAYKNDSNHRERCGKSGLTLPITEEQYEGVHEVRRSYFSFSQAADENELSRILVGYHFRKAVEEGIKHGRKIGKRAVDHFLKPVD